VNQVVTNNEDGSMTCANCKPPQNTTTTTGSATGGTITQNGDGSQNAAMNYTTPNDGGVYSGTSEVIVKDANGNTLYDLKGAVYNFGDGLSWTTGITNVYIPVGASVYINVQETNSTNTKAFSGSWHLKNWAG
jgi:uncharacterized protein (DUF2147 family)